MSSASQSDEEARREERALESARAAQQLILWLIDERERQGLSPSNVADRIGAHVSVILEMERLGGDPQLSLLRRYANALGARLRFGVIRDEPAQSE